MTDDYDLAPSKETYRSLQSDVSPIAAVKELVDNALDNWRSEEHDSGSVTIDISIDEVNDQIRVRDDSGGVAEDNIENLFALGESSVNDVSQPIGAYGMGAKKAIVRLGNQATIKSRVKGSEAGYGFSVDEEWLNSDGWLVDSQTFRDVSEGETIIEIEDLELNFGGDENQDESQYNNLRSFTEALITDLGETYERFLSGEVGPADKSVSITVNGESVKAIGGFNCSHTPYDGHHPRHFKNIEIEVAGRSEPVYMDLKAGILEEGGREQAGTDVYIQNRKVISRNTEEEGGWTPNYLGNYQPARGRARFQIRIYTDGRTDTLPWDTQKRSIDPYDEIMRKAFNFLKRAGKKFAVTYGSFPATFTQPYPDSNQYAVETDQYDYSGQNDVQHNLGHTPNEERPQASEVMNAVETHLDTYAIEAPHLIAEPLRLGYNNRHNQQGEGTVTWAVPEAAHHLGEQKLYVWLETIKVKAGEHAELERGIEFGENAPWWQSYYEQCLSQHTGGSEIPRDEDVSTISTRVQEKVVADELPAPMLEAAARDPPNGEESGLTVETDTDDSDIEGGQSDSEGDSSNSSSAETLDEASSEPESENEASEEVESGPGGVDSTGSENTVGDVTDKTATDAEDNGSDSIGPSSPSTRRASGDKELIIMQTSSEEFEVLCEEFDLPSDGAPEEIGDALFYTLIEKIDSEELGADGEDDS